MWAGWVVAQRAALGAGSRAGGESFSHEAFLFALRKPGHITQLFYKTLGCVCTQSPAHLRLIGCAGMGMETPLPSSHFDLFKALGQISLLLAHVYWAQTFICLAACRAQHRRRLSGRRRLWGLVCWWQTAHLCCKHGAHLWVINMPCVSLTSALQDALAGRVTLQTLCHWTQNHTQCCCCFIFCSYAVAPLELQVKPSPGKLPPATQ